MVNKENKIKINIEKTIKELEIAVKTLVTTRVIGRYRSVFRGHGLEFEEYRPYTPQDDASDIDWKASIRTNKLLIKQYKEERNLKLFFIIDISESMVFGSTPKLKNEYAAELVASIAYLAQKSRDNFGFALFKDKLTKVVLSSSGNKQFYILLKELSNPLNYGGGFKLKDTLKFLFNILDETTVAIIISDFIGIDEDVGWKETIKLFSQKFDTITIMVRDPRDEKLPEDVGEVIIEDPYSNETLLINSKLLKQKYEDYVKKNEDDIKNFFRKEGIDFLKLTTDKSFVQPLIELFKRRATHLELMA